MKTNIALMLIIISTVSAMAEKLYSQEAKVSITSGEKSVGLIIDEIENQSDFYFVFNQKQIDVNRMVNVEADNESIDRVLSKVFKEIDVKTIVVDNKIFLTTDLKTKGKDVSAILSQQEQQVKGTVKDGTTGESLPGVTIIIPGTTIGTTTDIDGAYSIAIPDGTVQLQYSYIGYTTVTVNVENRDVIDILLESDIQRLDEIVVVGYGTQTRRQITGSVSNVTEESFTKGVTTIATDLLKGRVAGLMVNSGSGDITKSSVLRLRGTTTLMNDDGPLIVIDGIPGGDLNTVSPSDIESMTVLKDATSAAIYGSRAAGGVVLITTKKGSGGSTSVSYDGYMSLDVLDNKPDLMTADEWRAYAQENQPESIATYDKYNADTDWFDELTRKAFSQNHAISLSGGTGNSNYRASYTYQDRKGVMRDNSQTQHNFRLQAQQRALNDKLRFNITGSASITDQELPYATNYILAYSMLPVYPVYLEDGSYFTAVNGEYDQGNPVQNQNLNKDVSERVNFYGTGELQYTITKGLNIKANIYKSRSISNSGRYYDFGSTAGRSDHGLARRASSQSDRTLTEWTLDYDKTLGKHSVQGLAGYSWEYNTSSSFSVQNRNFLTNALTYNSVQSGLGLLSSDIASSKSSYTLISMFARGYYGFDDRYMITAMIRRDGSSKFGANHKWGIFPSVSLAWGISEEAFMENVGFLNELKLRAGWGRTGNQTGLSPYNTLQLYETSSQYYDAGNWAYSYKISQNENPDLRWETTSTTNVGIDFSMFNSRFGGTIEWYSKVTSDMLYTYTVPTPPYVYGEMMANVGAMKNSGLEVLFNISLFNRRNFKWDMNINGSYNKNIVTSLSNDFFETERVYTGSPWLRGASGVTSHVLEEGKPIGQFFMLECNEIVEGKYIFTDLNNDGNIDDSDRTYAGTALPDVVFGINNSFSYKGFDMSIFFRGMAGNEVFNNPRCAYANNTYLIGTNALDDELTYTLSGQNSQVSSYYIEDASFIRLDNMSLGYTFNTSKVNWLDRARIYVAGQNLLLLTGYKGLDPEVSLSGLAPGIEVRNFYPKSKSFTFGVNLTF